MDFTSLTVDFLKILNNITGSYGLAIIALTLIVRVAMWPLGLQQQRSMKAMQVLQPKIKALQDRYKNDPQTMQKKMMDLYKENKCNPMSGCLPLLIQMPIFILLYTALVSPQFIQVAGDSNFLFIDRLDKTLRGSAAISYDGNFSVNGNDRFSVFKKVVVNLGEETLENVKIKGKNPIEVQGAIVPNETLDLKIDLDNFNLKYSQLEQITSATIDVQNQTTREVETITFEKRGNIMAASIPTSTPKNEFNWDVLLLILLFAGTMIISQEVMMKQNKNVPQDPMQQQMQKTMKFMMPIMIMFMFIVAPIPAGVLLYFVVSNIFQVFQTIIINKQMDEEDKLKVSSNANKMDLSNAKTINPIETKTIETEKK